MIDLLWGSLQLRPYVFGFLAVYLLCAIAEWGARRAAVFTALASGLAFIAEWTSTRVGVPFGLYHYTGATRGQELFLGNVPLFDPISFSFLAYASLGLARRLLAAWGIAASRGLALAGLTGVLMMWLDLVIDPAAVRGDRWFLGAVFYYPEPGPFFGVPLTNFAGWVALGAGIALSWQFVAARGKGRPPAWALPLSRRALYPVLLYYLLLVFNLAVATQVAEPALFWIGLALHLPLAAFVVFSLGVRFGAEAPAALGVTPMRPTRGEG